MSWSEFPIGGKVSCLLRLCGQFVRNRSKIISVLVGLSTICSSELSFTRSISWLCCFESDFPGMVHGTDQSMFPRLKSPPIIMLVLVFLFILPVALYLGIRRLREGDSNSQWLVFWHLRYWLLPICSRNQFATRVLQLIVCWMRWQLVPRHGSDFVYFGLFDTLHSHQLENIHAMVYLDLTTSLYRGLCPVLMSVLSHQVPVFCSW